MYSLVSLLILTAGSELWDNFGNGCRSRESVVRLIIYMPQRRQTKWVTDNQGVEYG